MKKHKLVPFERLGAILLRVLFKRSFSDGPRPRQKFLSAYIRYDKLVTEDQKSLDVDGGSVSPRAVPEGPEDDRPWDEQELLAD